MRGVALFGRDDSVIRDVDMPEADQVRSGLPSELGEMGRGAVEHEVLVDAAR
jgi:hypothetical protein